jgi:hypothetical protein
LVEVLLFGPLGIDLGLHPAAVEVNDGLAILELAGTFWSLQMPELRQIYLVDGGLVEKVVDDLSLAVVRVQALSQREDVQRIALEVAELGVEVGPRQVLGGAAAVSRILIPGVVARQDLVYVLLLDREVGELEKLRVLAEGETSSAGSTLLRRFVLEFPDSEIEDQPFLRVLAHEVHSHLQKMTQIVTDLLFVRAEFLLDF